MFAIPAIADARSGHAHKGANRADLDHDGLTNRYERRKSHTNPRRADTDRDGLKDRYELRKSHTNPRRADTDRDGLKDRYELRKSHTNPRRADTDGDGMNDGDEIKAGRDPLHADHVVNSTPQAPSAIPPAPTLPVDPVPVLLAPDTSIDSGPSGTVDSATATFTFSSSQALSSFSCKLDDDDWEPCSSPATYASLSNGQHTFAVAAANALGLADSTPASRTWTVDVPAPPDTTAPETSITSGPSGTVDSTSASFGFSSSEADSTFRCRIDGGTWRTCTSPKTYSSLADGSHTFDVRATDAAGNTDASPASRTWTVDVASPPDTTAPNTTINSGPSGTVSSASASFSFSSSESGSTFACRLDAGAWASCSSPKAYSGLADGSHTFDVRATDAAGNTDASPASRTWTIDTSGGQSGSGNNCMPNPSACGYPDASTTGVTPGTTLTPVNGVVTLSKDGQVYENKVVTGGITVTAKNVIIRNVRLKITDPYYGIRVTPGGDWGRNDANLLLDHVEIDLNGSTSLKGIAFNGYTARNVFFHNGADCAHMGENVVIEDSLCVDGPDTNSDGWPDSTAFCSGGDHFDGFQSDGGNNITIRHNTIRQPCSQTSNILLSSNTSHISNATIDDNLMAGGGYTLYCAGMNDRSSVDHIVATNNRFARTWYSTSGYWGPTAYCEFADTFSGNVWDDTGAPL